MTKLEKRQMLLMQRYQKDGIFRFVLTKGFFLGVIWAFFCLQEVDLSYNVPWYFYLLACLFAGWLFCYGLWFFVMWYFGKIKKRLSVQEPEAMTPI